MTKKVREITLGWEKKVENIPYFGVTRVAYDYITEEGEKCSRYSGEGARVSCTTLLRTSSINVEVSEGAINEPPEDRKTSIILSLQGKNCVLPELTKLSAEFELNRFQAEELIERLQKALRDFPAEAIEEE